MKRTTLDFGIDLGTTNSAIAFYTGTRRDPIRLVKNTTDGSDADITPSAIYINKRGDLRVGRRAKDRIAEGDDEDVAIEFKRQMGTDNVYTFKSSGQRRKPEDLSAEILKSLRGDVQQRTGEIIDAAVITVPAAFESHQTHATLKAAQLAGFKQSPLLQEPVAAALAYGLDLDNPKAYWLVFDFGGGTFDAAIIRSEEGTIHIVDHGGDNFLGGSNIDWAIVEKLLAPRAAKDFKLTDFVRGNPKWKRAFFKLKRNAEIAKIDLSRNDKSLIETCKFHDDRGEEIEFECELMRKEVINVAEPFIFRSAEIVKDVLKKRKLGKGAIEKIILVGGPTLAPYFREILATQLAIPLDHTVDPLTVVAAGAAVYAGTQRLDVGPKTSPAQGEYRLELAKAFRAVGFDSAPMIGGKVVGGRDQNFTGFTLELVNKKTQWRSGKISLRTDGVFTANLYAERDGRNEFAVELTDANGTKQQITPDTVSYAIGIGGDVEQPLINSIGISLAGNRNDILFEKGRGLPLKATVDYRTIRAVRQGKSEDACRIPIIEGEYERADRNRLNGVIEVRGDMIRRDLPAGSEVQVTLKFDESRILTVMAYVPVLDEEFTATIRMQHRQPDPEELTKEFEAEMKRLRDLKTKAAATGVVTVTERLDSMTLLISQIKDSLAAASADIAAALEVEKRILELRVKIDDAEDDLQWPTLEAEARQWLAWLVKAVDLHGNAKQKQRANDLAADLEKILENRSADRLRKVVDRIGRLHYEIVSALADWWIYQFQLAEKQQSDMVDQERAARLIDQGRNYISKNNLIGLQNVIRQLWDLLPPEMVEDAKRGYDPGLTR